MIRVMRIYEIAWSPSQKGDTDKQVCPCHPSPIASPKSVIISRAFIKKKDIIYTKWFWKWIMMTITSIPEKVFKKLNL
ncbi:MAG: hypothetical protein U9O54_02455, partial [Chloroflexota bacterium]|nr:hypothetical protein [Chloroflexota bacterium]